MNRRNLKKSDFAVGQTVYLLMSERGNKRRIYRNQPEKWIVAQNVEAIGKKYITAGGYKFDMTSDFRNTNDGIEDWEIYLTREDAENSLKAVAELRAVRANIEQYGKYMQYSDLKAINDIIGKYIAAKEVNNNV